MNSRILPRVLVIDDLFGRTVSGQRNEDRAAICSALSLVDRTEDGHAAPQISAPIAEAVFHRGQLPACAVTGDTVENDLAGILDMVRKGACSTNWSDDPWPCWSLILLDLCFYTGRVTETSGRDTPGMAEGRPGDDTPDGYFGLKVLEALREQLPDIPVVILSSMDRDPVARIYTGYGGMGFLNRTAKNSRDELKKVLDLHGLMPDEDRTIIGHSLALLRALNQARLATSDCRNVLILGETGTGKELFARYLNRHAAHPSGKREFVPFDSGSFTAELYASALFGHVKGAFTGAGQDATGALVAANGGDLFLDEIGNMPPVVQQGLLRAVQESAVRPLGGRKVIQVKVRYLAATNANIEKEMVEFRFRHDLYERLAQHTLVLPPLRERRGDIELLAKHYLREALREKPHANHRDIDPDALALLLSHDWRGNVRELATSINRAVTNFPRVEVLQPMHLGLDVDRPQRRVPVPATMPGTGTPHTAERVAAEPHAAALDEVIATLKHVDFAAMAPADWSGRMAELQDACARFMSAYLKAGLLATRRSTPKNPDGTIYPQPAVKLLTGNAELEPWGAYDIIKRICQFSPACLADIIQDPVLGPVLDRAIKARKNKAKNSDVASAPATESSPGPSMKS
jgi:DNA-binding NtrC family response regulator